MKALVVDDSGIIRSILVRVLRGMGVQRVVEAIDGRDAWEVFNSQPPDLVLTDWHMPHIDGLELTKRIRRVDPDVPVIMVTVVDTKDKVMEAIQAGISDYVCKPFERDTLESKLDRFIPV
jgi:two-component system chemotaxis response regulator CheY